MRKFLILTATVAAAAVTSLTVTSSVEARAHHPLYRNFGGYGFTSSYAPRYWYAAPYRYHQPFGSNLNPDRQMVGIGQ
jgi:hypothetical protein